MSKTVTYFEDGDRVECTSPATYDMSAASGVIVASSWFAERMHMVLCDQDGKRRWIAAKHLRVASADVTPFA